MTKELKADLWLLSATLVWGASFPVMSMALKGIPPYTFLALRYLLAGLIIVMLNFRKLNGINKALIKAGILIGVSILFGSAFQIVGLQFTTPSKSGFITGLNVIMVPIFIAAVYRKFPDVKTIAGVLLALAGLALMSINKGFKINFGDLLTLICAVCFAAQILLVDKFAKGMDAMMITMVELWTVGALSFIPAVAVEGFRFELSLETAGAIAFTAIFCTIYAYSIQNKMQPLTKPTHAAIIFLAEPVFSAIFSAFIGDKLTGKTLIGCLLIFTGMIVIELKIKSKSVMKETLSKELS